MIAALLCESAMFLQSTSENLCFQAIVHVKVEPEAVQGVDRTLIDRISFE